MLDEIQSNFKYKIYLNVISFLVSVFIVRFLGVDGRGALSSLSILILSLVTLANFGSGNGVIYFINRHFPKQEIVLGIIVRLIARTLITGFIVLLVIIKVSVFEAFREIDSKNLMFIFALFVIETVFFYCNKILIGRSQFIFSNRLLIFIQISNVLCLLLCSNIFTDKIFVVVISVLISKFLALSIFLYHEKWKVSNVVYDEIQIVHRFGWKTYLSDISSLLQSRFDQIALAMFLTLDQLGTYVIMVYLAEIVYLIPDSIGPSLLNLNYKNGSNDVKLNKTLVSMRLGMFCSLLFAVFIYYISIFILLPHGFGLTPNRSVYVLRILLVGTFLYGYAKYISKYLSGVSGLVAFVSKTMIAGTLLNIIFVMIALMLQKSILFVAIATTLSNIVVSIIFLSKLMSITELNYKDVFLVTISDLKRLVLYRKN